MKHKITAIIFAILFSHSIKAQVSLILLDDLPQKNYMNSAIIPMNDWYVAVPLIGSYGINIKNSGFSWYQFATNNLEPSIQSHNIMSLDNKWQLAGAGINYKETYFTFDVYKRQYMFTGYNEEFMNFTKGNWNYDNNTPIQYTTTGLKALGIDYTEISFGIAREISENFNLGVKLKYLMGSTSVQVDNFDLNISTEKNGEISINSDLAIFGTGLENVELENKGVFSYLKYDDKFLYFKGNHGLALDFAITKEFDIRDKNLEFGLALNDLGYINWKNQAERYSLNGSYDLHGVDISSELTGSSSSTIIQYWEARRDSLYNNFFMTEDAEKYKTHLAGNICFTTIYNHNDWLNFSVLFKNYYVNKTNIPLAGFSTGIVYDENYNLTLSYSFTKNSYSNLGLGVSARFGAIQIYGATDNLNTIFAPHKAKTISFNFGANIMSQFNSKKHSKSYIDYGNSKVLKNFNKPKYQSRFGGRKIKKQETLPRIFKLYDKDLGDVFDNINSGQALVIEGSKIKIDGDNDDLGIYLVSKTDNSRIQVDQILVNDSDKIEIILPTLNSGEYILELNTQYNGNKKLSKKTKKVKYYRKLTVK